MLGTIYTQNQLTVQEFQTAPNTVCQILYFTTPNVLNKKHGLPTGTLPVCKNQLLALCLPMSNQDFLRTGLPHILPCMALWHLDGSAKIQH